MVDAFAWILWWISRMILWLMTLSHLVIFLKGNLLQISSGLKVILGYSCFTHFDVLKLSRDEYLYNRVRLVWFLMGSLEFSFLVNCLGSNFLCLLFFIFGLDWRCRACFRFFFFLIRFRFSRMPCRLFSCLLSRRRLSVSFLVFYCLIRFDGTWSFLLGNWCWIFVSFQIKSCILMWSRTKSYGWLTGYST